MMTIYPRVLKPGDEVRVIAPARSLALIAEETRQIAKDRLEKELGLKLTFGQHVKEKDRYASSSIKSRVADLQEAFADKNVKAILTVLGGFNSEELLESINWELIRKNPKILCGFSDITALSNAIYTKTGLVSFSGPHYSSFGMKRGFEYTLENFKAAVMSRHRYEVLPSTQWSDDPWYLDQEKREFIPNQGMEILKPGTARGRIVGGNLSTLAIFQGTVYLPKLEDSILFIEDDDSAAISIFMRQFGGLARQPGFNKIKGLVFGRFQKTTKWEMTDFKNLIARRSELQRNIPIICNADFGHTTPIFTFGVGGTAEIVAEQGRARLFFEPFVTA